MKKNQLIVIASLLIAAGTIQAQTWLGGSPRWDIATNWSNGNVPNTVSEYALFNDTGAANRAVNLVTATTIGRSVGTTLEVAGTGNYQFGNSGPGGLTIQRNSGWAFANDINITTPGTVTFNTTVLSTWNSAQTTAQRFNINQNAGSLVFNQLVTSRNGSLQINVNSGAGAATFNGGVFLDTGSRDFWLSSAVDEGIKINSTVTAGAGAITGTINVGSYAGSVLLANTSGVAVDSSVSQVLFAGGGAVGTSNVKLGADDQIASKITMGGGGAATVGYGRLDLNGFSNENAAALLLDNVSGNGTLEIDFSDVTAESLWFTDSSAEAWDSGMMLNLIGFELGKDTLRFGIDASGLTVQQLSQIRIDGAVVNGVRLDSNGYLKGGSVLKLVIFQ